MTFGSEQHLHLHFWFVCVCNVCVCVPSRPDQHIKKVEENYVPNVSLSLNQSTPYVQNRQYVKKTKRQKRFEGWKKVV